jgi:hypothetical protein
MKLNIRKIAKMRRFVLLTALLCLALTASDAAAVLL